jgi:hypothetical protein
MNILDRFIAWIKGRFRREPYVTSAVHCVNCGHSYVAVIPASSPNYYPELGVFDMLECPECGLFTVCSS